MILFIRRCILWVQFFSYIYTQKIKKTGRRLVSGSEAACHSRACIHAAKDSYSFPQRTGLLTVVPSLINSRNTLAFDSGQNCINYSTVWKTTEWKSYLCFQFTGIDEVYIQTGSCSVLSADRVSYLIVFLYQCVGEQVCIKLEIHRLIESLRLFFFFLKSVKITVGQEKYLPF